MGFGAIISMFKARTFRAMSFSLATTPAVTNKKQFQLNEKAREKLTTASTSLAAAPPTVEKAKEALKENEALITT